MKSQTTILMSVLAMAFVVGLGCKPKDDAPSFSLAWSEYPSWSVFGVADELGLDTTILAKRRDLDAIVRTRSLPPSLQGWRKPVIGEPLLQALD